MYPLLCNPDEHVLATIGSLVLALIEGRTDLPLSGVFGAGKTRSAAILVVGLLVFEPNLNLMILRKENVAAQAFAEHIEAFQLPPCVTSKLGRLVGYMELKKNKTNKTSLDVTCENRHEVLRQKKLLIGCGGGFQQECSQSYSPVARWITEVALTLTDESQQYGNIEETSVIARTPRPCLNIWAGDHRQTCGGLKNTVECRLFRQKLLQRPLALRCGTEYVQPHEMHRIVSQYLDGPCDAPSHQLKLLLDDAKDPSSSKHITAVTQLWCEIFGKETVWLNTSVCVTCFAILWLAVKGEGVSSPVADTLDAAAQGSPGWPIKLSLVLDILSWSSPCLMVGDMEDMSQLKPRCKEASSLFSGMYLEVICAQLVPSALWLSGYKNTLPLATIQQITLPCYIIRTTWCKSLEWVHGWLSLIGRSYLEVLPLVLAWLPLWWL